MKHSPLSRLSITSPELSSTKLGLSSIKLDCSSQGQTLLPLNANFLTTSCPFSPAGPCFQFIISEYTRRSFNRLIFFSVNLYIYTIPSQVLLKITLRARGQQEVHSATYRSYLVGTGLSSRCRYHPSSVIKWRLPTSHAPYFTFSHFPQII